MAHPWIEGATGIHPDQYPVLIRIYRRELAFVVAALDHQQGEYARLPPPELHEARRRLTTRIEELTEALAEQETERKRRVHRTPR